MDVYHPQCILAQHFGVGKYMLGWEIIYEKKEKINMLIKVVLQSVWNINMAEQAIHVYYLLCSRKIFFICHKVNIF